MVSNDLPIRGTGVVYWERDGLPKGSAPLELITFNSGLRMSVLS